MFTTCTNQCKNYVRKKSRPDVSAGRSVYCSNHYRRFAAVNQRVFITFTAAFTVRSTSSALWAMDRKPASNCDGAR